MVCAPCAAKAKARREAMMNQIKASSGTAAANKFAANTSAQETTSNRRVLPRYNWAPGVPITNTEVKPTTVWNAWYQAFMTNRS